MFVITTVLLINGSIITIGSTVIVVVNYIRTDFNTDLLVPIYTNRAKVKLIHWKSRMLVVVFLVDITRNSKFVVPKSARDCTSNKLLQKQLSENF